jgi:hypothetical protein
MFELVMEHLNESHQKILNVAKKYYKYAQTQLLGGNKSIDYVLKQAIPFAKKVPLTDAEIDAFRRLVEEMIEGKVPSETSTYRHISSVGSLFGVSSVEQVESMKDNLSSGDFAKVQDIVRMEAENKQLYQQVVLQSVQFQDCDLIAVSGKYDQEKHNAYQHVHPLIVALYLPKFDIVDRTTVHAHLAGIVRARYNREPVVNQVDKELFDNIIYTNRREVCSMNPAEDLARRCKLQYAIWENVLALRSGRYYNVKNAFMSAVESCHLTYVSPTNTVVNDEGAMLRRLYGSFGLNTIIFSLKTDPTMGATMGMPVNPSLFVPTLREEERTSFDSIITVDMADSKTRNGAAYNLGECLNATSYYLNEKDQYVRVQTEVVGAYGLLSFYVPRRMTSVMQRQVTAPTGIASAAVISFNQLPLTISGLSELNNYPVIAPLALPVGGSGVLHKRSVLVNEVIVYASPTDASNATELVVSTSTIVYDKGGDTIYYYNPTGVVTTLSQNGQVGRPDPFSMISAGGDNTGEKMNANYLESRQGTLFIYGSLN